MFRRGLMKAAASTGMSATPTTSFANAGCNKYTGPGEGGKTCETSLTVIVWNVSMKILPFPHIS